MRSKAKLRENASRQRNSRIRSGERSRIAVLGLFGIKKKKIPLPGPKRQGSNRLLRSDYCFGTSGSSTSLPLCAVIKLQHSEKESSLDAQAGFRTIMDWDTFVYISLHVCSVKVPSCPYMKGPLCARGDFMVNINVFISRY